MDEKKDAFPVQIGELLLLVAQREAIALAISAGDAQPQIELYFESAMSPEQTGAIEVFDRMVEKYRCGLLNQYTH